MFKAFEVKAEAGCIPAEHFDFISGLVEKAKEVTGESIHGEPMFHQGGEAVNPLSHVGGFKAQEYADRGRQAQHDVSPAIRVARAEVSCEEGNSSFAPEGSVRVHEL